ncbi:MAG: methyltransferase domain-containing protein [Acidobacteriota bacterium]|nr:methyltransferase domain-containing protein [Acidobacteriota bacterium]
MRWLCEASGRGSFARALDVGCGAGQSSEALAEVAARVSGVDAAAEMLAHAVPHERIAYQQGSAEHLEFPSASFDLVTVGAALHWFDQPQFYAECRRVMAPGALLLVYNDHFTAHAQQVLAVKHWMRSRFARRFPIPRRGMRDMTEAVALEAGFRILRRGSFEHLVPYRRREFIDFLLTRSNTLVAIQQGRETPGSVTAWMDAELAQILPGEASAEPTEFLFKCNLWLLALPVEHSAEGWDAATRADTVK